MNERKAARCGAIRRRGAFPLRGEAETAAPGRKLAWSRPSVRVMDIERTRSGQPMVTYLENPPKYANVHS